MKYAIVFLLSVFFLNFAVTSVEHKENSTAQYQQIDETNLLAFHNVKREK
jgi:hypothetical protein